MKHPVEEQPGNIMPKNAKDMKLNPNRDTHSSFCLMNSLQMSIQTNIQTDNSRKTDGQRKKTPITSKSAELKNYQLQSGHVRLQKEGEMEERTLYFIILCAFWDKPKLNLFCLGTYDSFLWPKKSKDVPKVVDTKYYKQFGGEGLL